MHRLPVPKLRIDQTPAIERTRRLVALVLKPITDLTPERERAQPAPMCFGVGVGHRTLTGRSTLPTNVLDWTFTVPTDEPPILNDALSMPVPPP